MPTNSLSLNTLLLPVGTPGDVQPFVDLGLGMQSRGHRVTLVANEYFAPMARKHGFEFAPTGAAAMYEKMLADKSLWIVHKAHRVIAKWLVCPEMRCIYRTLKDRFEPGRTVVAAQTMAWGARIAQEKLGIPLATVHRQPAVMRSVHSTSAIPYAAVQDWVPAPIKRVQFAILDKMMDRPFLEEFDAFRAELNLPRVRRIGKTWMHSPAKVLCFWPDWFAPMQPDWPARTRLAGFIARESGEREADQKLRTFLESGDAPVVVTFGSGMKHAGELYGMAVQACRALGRRGILVSRFPEQVPQGLPANMMHASYVPFTWLLPRACAVVHHGGIGTMGQSFAAGIPQLSVPGLVFDTLDNARRATKVGAGNWIGMKRCTSAKMMHGLGALLENNSVLEQCKSLAKRVQENDAVALACDELEATARATACA